MDNHVRLRGQIRAGRELIGLKQADLAETLGVSLSKISRAESGETKSGDTLLELKSALERRGVRFTHSGVELRESHVEILEGPECALRLLDRIFMRLKDAEEKKFMVLFSCEKVSPPEVNVHYQMMLDAGITFRKLVSDQDDHILGNLEDYRTIPAKYFNNIVTLIYGDRVAQFSGSEKQVTIHHDSLYAERERKIFSYLWDIGGRPGSTSAKESERFKYKK